MRPPRCVGCSSEKVGKLIPYVVSPDNTVPGVSQYYATVCGECATGCGILAETRDGRTIKLEGNPEHPLNRGAICATGLSAVQGLYNPDRFDGPRLKNGAKFENISWDKAYELLAQKMGEVKSRGQAANVVFINQHETGTFPGFIDGWLSAQGMPAHYSVDSEAPLATIAANQKAYGVEWPKLEFGAAKLVLSFGADFLDGWGLGRSGRNGLGRCARETHRRTNVGLYRRSSFADRFECRSVDRVQAGQRKWPSAMRSTASKRQPRLPKHQVFQSLR